MLDTEQVQDSGTEAKVDEVLAILRKAEPLIDAVLRNPLARRWLGIS